MHLHRNRGLGIGLLLFVLPGSLSPLAAADLATDDFSSNNLSGGTGWMNNWIEDNNNGSSPAVGDASGGVFDNIVVSGGTAPPPPPPTTDTDGDGLLDAVEDGTGVFVDADHTGTDPNEADSDGDGLEVTAGSDPNDPADPGKHLLGIDFNRSDAFNSPGQSLFRIVSGSTTQANNATSYTKTFGSRQVTVSQPDGTKLEFRGANDDSSRKIPGGDISLSFLVADFIATREGTLDIEITNLTAGDYVFRSYHLDPVTGNTLGFAQGTSSTTANTIEARIGGVLQDSVQANGLGTPGLNTTFIDDSQIPKLEFVFSHDGSSPLAIELIATQSNGADQHLLLNGFELFQTSP